MFVSLCERACGCVYLSMNVCLPRMSVENVRGCVCVSCECIRGECVSG